MQLFPAFPAKEFPMFSRRFVQILLLASLLPVRITAQAVQPYPQAITNRNFYPKTPMAPPPVNTVFADPDLGALMVRVTDDNTNPKVPRSFFRNPPNSVNEWSSDGRKFYVSGANSANLAFAFDPSTMTFSALPGAGSGTLEIPLRAGPTFSFVDADLMYGTDPTAPLTITTYRFSTGKTMPLFDTTACATRPQLVAGPKVSSVDTTTSNDDRRIVISAGADSAGAEPFVIVYDQKLGCRWYNTETGEIGGRWGPSGQAATPDLFPVNHSEISGDGNYVRIGRARSGFYVWDIKSLDVTACKDQGGPNCSGYGALGLDTYINAPGNLDELNSYRRPLDDLSDLTPLINPLPLPHYFGMEKNFAWNPGRLNNNVPVCATLYSPTGDPKVKQPYDGEIVCIETDGLASTVWRFAHNREIWDPEYYWTLPYGNLSLNGRFLAFTSSWDEQVGTTELGGDDPRTDVWVVKLD
jgi:hypothetical protein